MLFVSYRLLLTRRCKLVEVFMTVVMYRLQQHGRRGQRIDTRHPGKQSQKLRLKLGKQGEVKLVAFFSWQENLMVSTRFLSLWSPR